MEVIRAEVASQRATVQKILETVTAWRTEAEAEGCDPTRKAMLGTKIKASVTQGERLEASIRALDGSLVALEQERLAAAVAATPVKHSQDRPAHMVVHKPKKPQVLNGRDGETAVQFAPWIETVRRYFQQVVCANVGATLLEFLDGTPAIELQSLLEADPDTDLETCLQHIKSVCVSHQQTERIRRGLLSITASSGANYVRAFWKSYGLINSKQRPNTLWTWTILLHGLEASKLGTLAKELRKDILRNSNTDEELEGSVTVAQIRKASLLAVGLPPVDAQGDWDMNAFGQGHGTGRGYPARAPFVPARAPFVPFSGGGRFGFSGGRSGGRSLGRSAPSFRGGTTPPAGRSGGPSPPGPCVRCGKWHWLNGPPGMSHLASPCLFAVEFPPGQGEEGAPHEGGH